MINRIANASVNDSTDVEPANLKARTLEKCNTPGEVGGTNLPTRNEDKFDYRIDPVTLQLGATSKRFGVADLQLYRYEMKSKVSEVYLRTDCCACDRTIRFSKSSCEAGGPNMYCDLKSDRST